MDIDLLLKGALIGFSIAAPVSPIGLLCIRRTLAEGRASGFVSGLGAASADALYGGIAGFGLTFISSLLVGQQAWLRFVGGVFLCYFGIHILLAMPAQQASPFKGGSLFKAYASTLFLTLTNPMTILSFAAVFAGLGLASSRGNYMSASLLVLGVFIGSASWWLLLSGAVGAYRNRVPTSVLVWVNRISGVIIVGFGLFALVGMIHR